MNLKHDPLWTIEMHILVFIYSDKDMEYICRDVYYLF